MSVRQLQQSMDSEELSTWMAYDKLDRLPDLLWVCGKICQTIVAAFAGKHKDIDDFTDRPKPVRILSGDVGRMFVRELGTQQQMIADRLNAEHGPVRP